jgi:hypothetical protein
MNTFAVSDTNDESAYVQYHRLGLLLGFVTIAMVIIIYVGASYYDIRPAGHPVSGIVWCAVAYAILRPAIRRQPIPAWFYWIYGVLVVVGTIVWLAATVAAIPK